MTDIKRNIAEIEKAAADFVDVEMKPQNMTEGRIGVQSFVAGYRLAESLASQVEAGITIEQARELAVHEFGYGYYADFLMYLTAGDERSRELEETIVNRIAEIYASSAVEAAEKVAVEKERERILEILLGDDVDQIIKDKFLYTAMKPSEATLVGEVTGTVLGIAKGIITSK